MSNDLNRFYAENVGLVHTAARRGYRRLACIGANMEYEDLFQDLSMVFVLAYERFDAATGFQFSTYFIRAAFNHINRIAKRTALERIGTETSRIEDETGELVEVKTYHHAGQTSFDEAPEGSISIEEAIPCPDGSPEELLIVGRFGCNLSPLAQLLLRLTLDPPDFLEHEFAASQAHAQYARQQGKMRRARETFDIAFVCAVLNKTTDLSRNELAAARQEIAGALQ